MPKDAIQPYVTRTEIYPDCKTDLVNNDLNLHCAHRRSRVVQIDANLRRTLQLLKYINSPRKTFLRFG
jgi:hypothetical protein